MRIAPNIEVDDRVLAAVCDRYGIAELKVFGSRARYGQLARATGIAFSDARSRDQHAVGLDAGDEVLVQPGIEANVGGRPGSLLRSRLPLSGGVPRSRRPRSDSTETLTCLPD